MNRLAPDIVLLTGDYVSEGPMLAAFGAKSSYPCAEILSGIHCPQRWSVLGNHDVTVGAAIVTDALNVHGLPVLANAHVPYERNGARLWIGGVKDIGKYDPDLDLAAPRGLQTANEPAILLGHEPDYADRVSKHGGVDLMLAGHSHGGQVRVPLMGALYAPPLARKYMEGLFHLENGLQLYVNRGIGAVGVPFRFDCRPELTLFTLRSPPAVTGSESKAKLASVGETTGEEPMNIQVAFGKQGLSIELPEGPDYQMVKVHSAPPVADVEKALGAALDSPVAGLPLIELARGKKRRPSRCATLPGPLPTRSRCLHCWNGCIGGHSTGERDDLIATGLHRAATEAEMRTILGPEIAATTRSQITTRKIGNSIAFSVRRSREPRSILMSDSSRPICTSRWDSSSLT